VASGFTRTLRSIGEESPRYVAIGATLAGVFMAGWLAWFLLADLSVYETTTLARLEADSAASPVQSTVAGRVVESTLSVGRQVTAGDLLIQLDKSQYTLQIEEIRADTVSIEREIAGLRTQVREENITRELEHRAMLAAQEETQASAREAQAPARYSAAEEDRLRRLRELGLIADRDYQRGLAEADRSRAAVEKESVTVIRLEREQAARDGDRNTRIRKLETEIARLEGTIVKNSAAAEVLRNEMGRLSVRAPITGRIGEAATLHPGSVVAEGDRLAAIVPEGTIQIVAQFPPAALGRIAAGQKAAMRLQAFPWTQYGALHATVTRAASEVRDGSIRVELELDHSHPTRIPLEHGLPGTLEIEVELATPASLVLRSIGRMIAAPAEHHSQGEAK
jgi:multidrug resistance efflux pump